MIQELQEIEHCQYLTDLSATDLISEEQVNIVVYHRALGKELDEYINQLLVNGFDALRVTCDVSDFDLVFNQHFNLHNDEPNLAHNLLKNDIKKLLEKFAGICQNTNLTISFGIVDTDMCRRFHTDMYELRMLCTYAGQGTMWLSDDNINYEALNSRGGNDEIVLREDDIKQVNTGDVAIIKGALHPNSKVGGLVHRSPTIESLNQKRVVLRVDSNSLLDNIE